MSNIKISQLSNITYSTYTPEDLLVIVNYKDSVDGITKNTKISDIKDYVLSGVSFDFTGNTSASCINDLYVTNLNSCSPLHIQPTNNGDVYIGESGGVNVGIGTLMPSEKLEVSGKTKTTNLQVTSGSPQSGYVLTATDNEGNVTWSSPSDGFTYQIGEYVSSEGGVIYHREKSGTTQIYHIVSLQDLNESNWGFNNIDVESNSRWNGEENTDKINQYIPNLQTQAANLVNQAQLEQSQYETEISNINQQIVTIQQQIVTIQQQIETINQEYGSEDGPPTDPNILAQLQQLQNDLNQLEGDLNQLEGDINQLNSDHTSYIANFDQQYAQLQGLIQDVQSSSSECAGITSRNYNGSGKSDWYLPSIAELVKIWSNQYEVSKGLEEAGGTWFYLANYWSSTETDLYSAWAFVFLNGTTKYHGKSNSFYVRVVRQFSI